MYYLVKEVLIFVEPTNIQPSLSVVLIVPVGFKGKTEFREGVQIKP